MRVTFASRRLEYTIGHIDLKKPPSFILLILAGAISVFTSNVTITYSKNPRDDLSGNEGM